MDRMHLEGMEFFGYHGVIPEENRLGQRFRVDLTLHLDLRSAARQDNLDLTVNYADVYRRIKDIVEGQPVRLIETLAERIATDLLNTYTGINAVNVKVTKLHPPFDIHFSGVSVEIFRESVQT